MFTHCCNKDRRILSSEIPIMIRDRGNDTSSTLIVYICIRDLLSISFMFEDFSFSVIIKKSISIIIRHIQ